MCVYRYIDTNVNTKVRHEMLPKFLVRALRRRVPGALSSAGVSASEP